MVGSLVPTFRNRGSAGKDYRGSGYATDFAGMLTKGKYAKAQCPICGLDGDYSDLRKDWRGVHVCKDCVDIKPFPPPPKPKPKEGWLPHPAPRTDVLPVQDGTQLYFISAGWWQVETKTMPDIFPPEVAN